MKDIDALILENLYSKIEKYVVVDPTGNGINGYEYGAYNLDGTGQWEFKLIKHSDGQIEEKPIPNWETNFHIFDSRDEALIFTQNELRPNEKIYLIRFPNFFNCSKKYLSNYRSVGYFNKYSKHEESRRYHFTKCV